MNITDPTYSPKENPNWFDRLALKYINDPRDLPFIYVMAGISLIQIPFAMALFIPGVFRWWLAPIYWLVLFTFLPPFILMLHNTSHRRLFKREYKRMNAVIPWYLGPFMGESPETYFAHHIGMHHPENNLPTDLSSTMRFQRDSVIGFLRYFGRFFVFGLFELARYHWTNRRAKMFRSTVAGEVAFYGVAVVLCFVDWRAGLVVFFIPLTLVRFLMMAGNWAQHAFVDADAPANCYRNSITCINTKYNHKAWNDGYHIGHHVKANRHWTEMPEDFINNLETYAKEGAIVFEGLDYFQIWLLLMLKKHRFLAERMVQLGEVEMSVEERLEVMHERLRRIDVPAPLEAAAAAAS